MAAQKMGVVKLWAAQAQIDREHAPGARAVSAGERAGARGDSLPGAFIEAVSQIVKWGPFVLLEVGKRAV